MKGQPVIHVGLNTHLLSRRAGYRQAGIHGYIQQLVRHLPATDERLRVTAFVGRGHERRESASDKSVSDKIEWQVSRWPTENPWMRIAWEQLVQPWALRRAGVDLLHATAFVSPVVATVPAVVTVHDLSFFRFPERFRPLNRLYLSVMTRLSCRRARRIIAVSQATADEIVRLLGVPAERIDVVPHGVQHEHFCPLPPEQVAAFGREKGLPERFVLFVGTLEPRKNLTTLLKAFAQSNLGQRGVKLIIAGGKGWHYQEIFRHVEALGLTDRVSFPGFVPDAELALWYNAATIFVYPSLYEGFGMPLLEAMACGTPVIGSDASSLPQVVGEAGLLVAPDDETGLAAQMTRLLTDADLRAELRRRGLARAATFTWETAAAATVASYRRAWAE